MSKVPYAWDVFIAHAGPDEPVARELYASLTPKMSVFLDSAVLLEGDDWDAELASAQKLSHITVVLVSRNTQEAYYQREEIAAAIAMARKSKDKHRVVPIYLGVAADEVEVPYGLRLKHGIHFQGKAEALELVSQRVGCTPAKAVFVGDHYNDESIMLKVAMAIAYPPQDEVAEGVSHLAILEDNLLAVVPHVLVE